MLRGPCLLTTRLCDGLADFRGIEGLVGGLEPIQQCLPGGESQRTDVHAQAAAADDFLQLLGNGFDGRRA
jgi:hypothetical protein